MLALVASITALLISTTILLSGSGLLGTLLSVRMTVESFGNDITGLVMSAYFLGLALGAIGAGAVVRRVGHIRSFGVFAALVTAATLLHALWIHPVAWGLLRVVAGFSLAGLYMVVESWLAERGQGGARGRLFSFYQIATYLGLGIGQFLLTLRPVETAELFIINAIIFAVSLIPVTMTRAIHPTLPERHRLQLRAVVTASPMGAIFCIGSGIITGSAFGLAPVFVVNLAGVQSVAVFMGALVLGGMILQYPLGHLSDRVDRRHLLTGVCVALMAECVFLIWAGGQAFVLLAAAGSLFGGLIFTLYPLAVAHINDRVQSESFVGIAATLLLLWGVGAVIGPILFGQVMAAIGPNGLVISTAATAAVLAVVALLMRGESIPAGEQGPYVTVTGTTNVISELDPRTEPEVDPQTDWIDWLSAQDAEAAATDGAAG